MKVPWRSAMNQGRAMEAFTLAFLHTGDSTFLLLAKTSMNTLYTEIKNGGVTIIDSTGFWYEEYADDGAVESRVLNGMMVVLIGLKTYYKVSEDPSAIFLFDKGVNALEKTLPRYDNNGFSYYDIQQKEASMWYHKFHIELLDYLYHETGNQIFMDYRDKWAEKGTISYPGMVIKEPSNIRYFTAAGIFILPTLFLFALFALLNRAISGKSEI